MKENIYYAGFLALVLLVFVATGPVISATTDTAQSPATTNQTQTTQEGTVRVAIGEGSNATLQHYTFTPQTVEINAGESVTWVSPSELADLHTVTFVLDPNVMSDIILPFAVSGNTSFELLPPFNLGEPVMTQTPDGRQAIVALNKNAWNPSIVDANNQSTYLNGTDIRYTMDGSEKVINSGIILAQMPPTGGAVEQNSSAPTGGEEIPGGAAVTNETTPMSNATEGGAAQPPIGPPFPPVSSFTVTFEQPGTYPYFCAIHPWMTGQVIVREGGNQTATEGGNQTATEGGNQTATEEQNGAGALASLFE
jgi:plastocyanin